MTAFLRKEKAGPYVTAKTARSAPDLVLIIGSPLWRDNEMVTRSERNFGRGTVQSVRFWPIRPVGAVAYGLLPVSGPLDCATLARRANQ